MIFDFILYGGDDTFHYHTLTDDEASLSFGAQIIFTLYQSIKNKIAVIFCDNISSPELFHILKKKYGIFGLETIRDNRILGHGNFLADGKAMKEKPRGFYV